MRPRACHRHAAGVQRRRRSAIRLSDYFVFAKIQRCDAYRRVPVVDCAWLVFSGAGDVYADSPGPATATLTVPSDDPVNLSVSVTVRANVGQPTIATAIADTGSFGSLCPAPNRFRDLPLTINNSGSCPLTVTGLSSSSGEFELPQVLSFPIKVAPGTSVALPVRFRPTSAGTKTATIAILSDDPVTPSKAVTVSGVAPPDYVCQPPLFAAIDAGVGPTFGTGRTGNYTVTGGGRVLASFGPQRTFAVQAQGDYRFYPGRQEGQLDTGLLYRRGLLQFGFAASFADANLRAEASPGLVTDAMLSLDVLLPAFRVGVFAAKGLRRDEHRRRDVAGSGAPFASGDHGQRAGPPHSGSDWGDGPGGAAAGVVARRECRVSEPARAGDGNTAGGGVRVSRLLFPGVVATAQFDVNESFVGPHTVGTVTFGVTLGRWSRPSDYSNPVNPLGTYVPKVRCTEIFDRVR